jgi:dipeptidyl aminopeptidase/acylaminoacyl peptidase
MVPEGDGPFAGLVLMHGMPGKRQHLGVLGSQYARAGAVVVLLDAPHARPEKVNRLEGVVTFTDLDRQEQIQLIVDLRWAVDLLIARADVDPGRVAYVGISYGGAMGGLLAGIEDRLKAYVLVVGDGGLVSHFTGFDDKGGGPFYQLTGLEQERWLEAMWPIEPLHYVKYAAPAELLFQSGLQDRLVPYPDAVRYQLAGSEPKQIIWYDSGHSLSSASHSRSG